MVKYQVLERVFGYSAFRPGQEELVDGLLEGRDVFGIMPTGGGKSICYQLPGLLMEGITLVISPLISLMRDQVLNLKASGVSAAYINSSLTGPQVHQVYRNLAAGQYKIVYVAPERLDYSGFGQLAAKLRINLIAVDEEGRAFVTQEVYEGRDLGEGHTGLIISEAAKRLRELAGEKKIYEWLAPPDMWNGRQETGRSVAEIFAEQGIFLTKSSNDRRAGWMAVRERLKVEHSEDGARQAMLCIFSTPSLPGRVTETTFST